MKTTILNNVKNNGFLAAQENVIKVQYAESLVKGDVTVDKMKAIGTVPVNAIQDMNSILAKASFAAEVSKVGSTTVSMQVGGSNPKVYFTEGSFDKKLFKKVFKAAGKAEVKGKKYESVFYEGINKFSQVDFEMGIKYTIYLVNKATIKKYQDELSTMCLDTVASVADVQQVIVDLDPIARALQESSIDVTKDKDKDFGIYATDIIGSDVQALNVLIKREGTINNLEACLEEPAKIEYKAELNVLTDKDTEAVETNASKAQLAILDGTNEFMNNLLSNYGMTTNDDYKNYLKDVKQYRDFVWFIRKVSDSMVGRLDEDGRLQGATIRAIRNAIYVEAERQGVPKELVVKCGIAAGYTNFYKNNEGVIKGTANVNKFRFATIAKIFDDIFVQEYAENKCLEVAVQVEDVYEDIAEGTVVTVKDGFGYIDGAIALTLLDVDAEGEAIVKDGRLMLQYNPVDSVEYNTKAVIVDSFLVRENGEWANKEVEGLKDIETHVDRLLNCVCGMKGEVVLAKNPDTGKAVRVATLDTNFENIPTGTVKVKDIVVSQRGAILLLEA